MMSEIMVFFFNDTATTEIYTLSLHDALPISTGSPRMEASRTSTGWAIGMECPILFRLACIWSMQPGLEVTIMRAPVFRDRKSTRLNSSHANISYAVFCLKKTILLVTLPIYHS